MKINYLTLQTAFFFQLRMLILGMLMNLPIVALAQPGKSINSAWKQKLSPEITKFWANNKIVSCRMLVKDTLAFRQWAREYLPSVTFKNSSYFPSIFNCNQLDGESFRQLLNCPWVEYIDAPNRTAREELALEINNLAFNKISPVHAWFSRWNGNGLTVSVKEKPFDKTDIDFRGRVVNASQITGTSSVHATTMATLIAGGGNSSATDKGVAWQARLTASDFKELLPDNAQTLRELGVSVQNHSYGVDIENYYGIESVTYDQQCLQFPEILHVFSSGNQGNAASAAGNYQGLAGFANLTGQFKMSKNTLSVGALESSGEVGLRSSRGPAYDGRIKPEIVALGEGGSSEAAALVSGVSLLLQQALHKKFGKLPPASLVKAILLNSADEIDVPGPDFAAGFGNLDALGAIRTVEEGRFWVAAAKKSDTNNFTVKVPTGCRQLKVTLVWHDPATQGNAPKALVNDLDLELLHSASGKNWLPWVLNHYPHPDSLRQPGRRQKDHLNNVEQITVDLPEAGSYEIRVTGYDITSGAEQEFGLTYEWEKGFDWIYPVKGIALTAGEPVQLQWQWSQPEEGARLEYRSTSTNQWTLLAGDAEPSANTFIWTPPDTSMLAQLRWVTEDTVFLSDTFTVSPPIPLQIGLACEGTVWLHWPRVPGITQYQLFRMGEQYLEPFQLTADTSLLFSPVSGEASVYAVAPVINGTTYARSAAADYRNSQASCYIESFLSRQLVTDTVWLDLSLTTLFQLKAIYLERWTGQEYKTITQIAPITHLQLAFTDPSPRKGANRYRIRLENEDGKFFYGPEEEVFYLRENEMVVFPNPVSAGEELSLVEGIDKQATIALYDSRGSRIKEYNDFGTVKTIPTKGLPKGAYLIRIRTETGRYFAEKLVVF